MEPPIRYQSSEEDSARWQGFPFRDGDIVISTRSKSGTTWVQMICALLVFGKPDLPARLSSLSPWLDWLVTPRDDVYEHLARQQHRRFIKTHTPLDGIPLDPRATYIVVGRHPLDMAVSLYHQGDNLDRERIAELTGTSLAARPARSALPDWLRSWIDSAADPRDQLDSLPGVMWHLSDAWQRREGHNVVLVHFSDLVSDLEGQMRGLAAHLDIRVAPDVWPSLVEAATFAHMRGRAADVTPSPGGVLKEDKAFFRRGTPGAGREVLDAPDIARYEVRAAELAAPDLLAWLHR